VLIASAGAVLSQTFSNAVLWVWQVLIVWYDVRHYATCCQSDHTDRMSAFGSGRRHNTLSM
jgi:hypothetical protein